MIWYLIFFCKFSARKMILLKVSGLDYFKKKNRSNVTEKWKGSFCWGMMASWLSWTGVLSPVVASQITN